MRVVLSRKLLLPGGAVAQLGARLDGIEEVVGSNPIGSTKTDVISSLVLAKRSFIDALSALAIYRARYYNPQLSRFISEDPIGFRGGINVYAYVGNNPISFVDPL